MSAHQVRCQDGGWEWQNINNQLAWSIRADIDDAQELMHMYRAPANRRE